MCPHTHSTSLYNNATITNKEHIDKHADTAIRCRGRCYLLFHLSAKISDASIAFHQLATAPHVLPLSRNPNIGTALMLLPSVQTYRVAHVTHPSSCSFPSAHGRTSANGRATAQDRGSGLISFFQSNSLFSLSFGLSYRHRNHTAALKRH